MIPTRRLIKLALVPALPLALSAWQADWLAVGVSLKLLLAAVALADLLLTPHPARIEIAREVAEVLSAGVPNPVRLWLRNGAGRALRLELTDEVPEPSQADGLPLRVVLGAEERATALYHLVPRRRGRNGFAAVHLRFASRLGLWLRQERRPLESPVRIYPDIRAVRRFDLLTRRNDLEEIGLKFRRLARQQKEFERLREYRRGDQLRQID